MLGEVLSTKIRLDMVIYFYNQMIQLMLCCCCCIMIKLKRICAYGTCKVHAHIKRMDNTVFVAQLPISAGLEELMLCYSINYSGHS
jgi:hypothetical protein